MSVCILDFNPQDILDDQTNNEGNDRYPNRDGCHFQETFLERQVLRNRDVVCKD